MTLARVDHAAATLKDGRVLIVGGSDGVSPMSLAEIFDPATGQSAGVSGAMSTARVKATATTMLDGHVLVVGGSDGANDLSSAEIFDSATGIVLRHRRDADRAQRSRRRAAAEQQPGPHRRRHVGGRRGRVRGALRRLERRVLGDAQPDVRGARRRRSPAGCSRMTSRFVAGGGATTGEYYGYATVKTDREDYWPGEPVTVTGSGWQPGETVTLTISEDADTHFDFTYSAVADAGGQHHATPSSRRSRTRSSITSARSSTLRRAARRRRR